jgi:RNA polymerase sigma factor (sigma-70 family)
MNSGRKIDNEGEIKLWNDFINGCNDAFGVIYNQHVQSLFKYGCHFTGDRDLVKDCIQDMFMDLHTYRKNISQTGNIRLYLFKSLKHKILKTLNKIREFSEIDHEDPFYYCISFEDELVTNETEKHNNALISKAFEQLSPRQKEAIYLKFVSQLSYEEISSILNVNYQSARNLVFRSLEKMREIQIAKMILFFFYQKLNKTRQG